MLKTFLLLAALFALQPASAAPLTKGWIRNSDVSPNAAIAYSKLNLTGSIVNADINSSAAIAYSKLNLSASIVNGDVASNAAIALSKLASIGNYSILGNSSASPGSVSEMTVTAFANMVRARVTATASIAAVDIDWSAADYFEKTLTGSVTLTFSNQRKGQCIMIDITNTTSNYTVTWPANVRWPSDTTPTATIGSKSDMTSCCYNGTVTKCSSVQSFRPN